MSDLTSNIAFLVIGTALSWWVSSYFFKKGFKKSLTPYIHYYTAPFRGIDSQVLKDLSVTYQGKVVEDLFEVQFLVANTGDKAIRDVISPLSIEIPKACTLLSATVIHQSPAELGVSVALNNENSKVLFPFPLMNSGDFFIVKLLLDGSTKPSELKFGIVVDELPRVLQSKFLEYGELDSPSTSKKSFQPGLLSAGVLILSGGVSLLRLIYDQWHVVPSLEGGWQHFADQLTFSSGALIWSIIPALFLVFIGAMMSAASFTDGRFPPKRRRFSVPESVRKARHRALLLLSTLEDEAE